MKVKSLSALSRRDPRERALATLATEILVAPLARETVRELLHAFH